MPRLPLIAAPDRRPVRPSEQWGGDAQRLERALRAAVEGEVRFDPGSRGAYATDASNYRQAPIGVVLPRSSEDVLATIAACSAAGAPLLSRGGGTSLAGQCCNIAVVIDFSKHLNRVLDIDPGARLARVQPGAVLDDLNAATFGDGLRFAPDPSTHSRCTIGGMIGNNACGVRSLRHGKTADNVRSLEIATYDGASMEVGAADAGELSRIIAGGGARGQIHARLRDLRDASADLVRQRFPAIPRRVSGYNLDQLLPEAGFHVARALVGSEGTCVTVLEATVELVDEPAARSLALLGFPDVYAAADAVPEVLAHSPLGCEGMDDVVIASLQRKDQHRGGLELLPEGGGWLLVEMSGASPEEAGQRARAVAAAFPGVAQRILLSPDDQRQLWMTREAGLAASAQVPGAPQAWPGWEDSAVPPERLGGYLRQLRALLDGYGYSGAMYGHFGDGCLHTRITFDLSAADGIAQFGSFVREAAELVISHGGSLSGEHGDGQARGELLELMFGSELVAAFRDFKAIWDPRGMMNPGKVVAPDPVAGNLRLGADYRPWKPETVFAYPQDGGSFARASLRCVGVGECRKTGAGVMCPSYMVTREEIHSTRGRARLLFEMLEGDPVRDGWRDEHVEEALSLCLSCKACKTECPVGVDMATYKAEFLSHRYAGRLRPRAAYAMGLIPLWARLAARAPRTANALLSGPVLGGLVKRAGGVHPDRRAPRFAHQTLAAWMARRPRRRAEGAPVLLWADTFTNHFQPDVGKAAVSVLERAGFDVRIPDRQACCARPLYEYGMLDTARRFLRRAIQVAEPALRSGMPVVVLEPSCAAAFRDELVGLLPGDADAQRLSSQTVTLAELLVAHGYTPPPLDRRIIVQRHCHHQAIMSYDADAQLLTALGADVELLDSGCCGMAGSFGYEPGKYEVSVGAAERVLLPAVRAADPDAIVMADGFSCRSQIADLAGRESLHLAQVLELAHRAAGDLPAEGA